MTTAELRPILRRAGYYAQVLIGLPDGDKVPCAVAIDADGSVVLTPEPVCERCAAALPDDADTLCGTCAEEAELDRRVLREEYLRDAAEDRRLEAYLERKRGIA